VHAGEGGLLGAETVRMSWRRRACGLNNKHVVYMLRVMNGDKQWICEKRYSDFQMLDDVLRSKFWYTAVPKLPSKKYFFNFDDEFIKKRKQELERYLKEVLQVGSCACNTHTHNTP